MDAPFLGRGPVNWAVSVGLGLQFSRLTLDQVFDVLRVTLSLQPP